ncbi:TonB-dependent receptor [Acinetobacter sp. S40]|uniref:TonB-dependent receptor plug domain-containing protein n=1 Tax=Acinetobacter sp. S40 TaxID=2767434 RepID=UPI00190B9D60|nr:TonB-dependent receptor [Acinetobacter sp. S40]MBJ9985700.1 TonB-dependent receptor [Acinetobacter sp. S40]
MKQPHVFWKISPLSFALLSICSHSWGTDADHSVAQTTTSTSTSEPIPAAQPTQTLKTITLKAASEQSNKDNDISAIPKTIITREEMLQYGDQSVSDALRRAAGFQMPAPGQGPRGNNPASGMRFRGGAGPTFLINGEAVQGGPRGGMSVIDTITTDMIERIEVIKQPSVAQASVASSAVINIILKEPLNTLINGNVRVGYGIAKSSPQEEIRKQVSLQTDGRDNQWSYSLSANQMWQDTTSVTKTIDSNGERQQQRTTDRSMQMFSPRLEYTIDDTQKLVADLFYRNTKSDGTRQDQIQKDQNDSIRLNTRYERKTDDGSDKIRISAEHQNETELTGTRQGDIYTDETVNEYALGYDGVRKLDPNKQIKFGFEARKNELESNVASTLDEERYALYGEGSWRFTDQQTVTLGVRQEWIQRSGLVDYSDQHASPVLAHRYEFDDHWSLQTNLSKAFQAPNANRLAPTVTISTDSDAGSLNNPDRGGNPDLKPEQITAIESTLGYNTAAGGFNLTAFNREIKDYIENVIRLEGSRYVQRPINQNKATAYGAELTGRYAIKETEAGHSLMVTGQVSTIHVSIKDTDGNDRLASDVAPYTASSGLSYSYKPWKLSNSINVSYTPKFTRALDNQPYDRTTNSRVTVDISTTKNFSHNWGATLSLKNILGTDYKEYLRNQSDGSLYQARINESIPNILLSIEKKF